MITHLRRYTLHTSLLAISRPMLDILTSRGNAEEIKQKAIPSPSCKSNRELIHAGVPRGEDNGHIESLFIHPTTAQWRRVHR